jgi:hypothetical protein
MCIGPVTYQLALMSELHEVFHVSQLRKIHSRSFSARGIGTIDLESEMQD